MFSSYVWGVVLSVKLVYSPHLQIQSGQKSDALD